MSNLVDDVISLRQRPSDSFYRNFFAVLTFLAFAVAILFDSSVAYLSTLLFGCLSRTAVKKCWKNPEFANKWFGTRENI